MINLKEFKSEYIKVLTPMMKRAFDCDSQMHLGIDDGPVGYDNGEFIKKWFMHKNATALVICDDEVIIGGINLWIRPDNKNCLGCLFIDPDYENKGIGTIAWKLVEEMFPDTIEWTTETPIFSRRNHNFYVNKCGFSIVKIMNPKDIEGGSYILKKVMK